MATAIVTAQSGLNVRSGPGTDYPVVRVLRYGQQVMVLDGANEWWMIARGQYVSAEWVRVTWPKALE